MSTERSLEAGARRRARVTVIAVFAILVLLASGLAIANLLQAPRLQSTDANTDLLVSRTAQRVQLHLSQPVTEVEAAAVSVTPAAPFEVSTNGGTVTLRFAGMLQTDTEYRISASVTGMATGSSGTVEAAFRTPDPLTYTLVRGDTEDRLLEHRVHDAAATRTAFTAPHIQEYAQVTTGLAVITRDDTGSAELAVHGPHANPGGGASDQPFRIMGLADLGQLRSEPDGGVLGVVGSGVGEDGTHYDRTLLVIDPQAIIVSTVTDDAGVALPVRDWRFIPGTTSLVFQTPDGRLHGWEAAPTPRSFDLGVSGDLLGFAPGSTSLAVATATGDVLLDLSSIVTGTFAGAPPATPLDHGTGDPKATLPLDTHSALVRTGASSAAPVGSQSVDLATDAVLVDPRSAGSLLGNGSLASGGQLLRLTNDGAATATADPGDLEPLDGIPVYTPAAGDTGVGRVCVSPNGEFAAVEAVSREGEPDGVPVTGGYSHTTTNYVRLTTGETVRSVIGGLSDWCR
ncbi:hypothetical protein [Leucobacter japonicus]|uniref:hypothetical protein n=1 Tax=Leucobacter japonicus TaxID=1461259 RepID=UPI0006A7646C|nr:hypothetical protein [Leucobacter japonicus]